MRKIEDVIAELAARQRRATYGAVAEVVGRPVRRLMAGQGNSYDCSWVVARRTVAKTGSVRGRPTGFRDLDIDPACLEQIRRGDEFIETAEDLERELRSPR
ncbi:hypothetical protein [Zavarzinella formosa]|uniref:hypothetical protein n=1 Tax=Zavarzinella formosa TaxID=360055 RepID=UPI0002EEB60E|nr:hypothetical protein [Zavarzinella formosa]